MQRFTGKDYLKIDIANNFGFDKKNWDERIDWFNSNEYQLEKLLKQAETPALYYAGIQAWNQAKNNQPSGYPISLDATASGLQLLAILTGDRDAAQLCNVVNTGNREDAYTVIYQRMINKIGTEGRITREDTKSAIMKAFYGSTAVPKQVFGEGALLQIFEETMIESAPGPWELNKGFLDIWDSSALVNSWILPDNFHVHIKVMSKVKEVIHFMGTPYDTFTECNMPVESSRSLGANTIHSLDAMVVREMTRRCDYDPKRIQEIRWHIEYLKQGGKTYAEPSYESAKLVETIWGNYLSIGYLSARILDGLNVHTLQMVDIPRIEQLLDSLPRKPFKVLSVHD